MVHLRFENLVEPPPADGQPRKWIEFPNHAGISPMEQWFYHWVISMNLAAPYPEITEVKSALQSYLPARTKRYSRNVPDLESGESWLRFVLMTGELIRLTPSPSQPEQTIAVLPANIERFAVKSQQTIASPEFAAVRRDLSIDKHWILLIENLAQKVPGSDELLNAFVHQALEPSECAVIRI